MGDTYHHGNLRQALIEAGIRIINESGEEGLSLRKVAAACNVSHAAPYAHFKDKEELLEAMKDSVTTQFLEELREAVEGAPDPESAILRMGKSYIQFFVKKPDYYHFLFGRQKIAAHLSADENSEEDYPPFNLLKNTYVRYLQENGIQQSGMEQEAGLLRIWASAHGLAALLCTPGVVASVSWEELLEKNELLR